MSYYLRNIANNKKEKTINQSTKYLTVRWFGAQLEHKKGQMYVWKDIQKMFDKLVHPVVRNARLTTKTKS